MSHEIDTMFSVRERPWHFSMTQDHTNILPTYPDSWDDARMAAGLMWEPRKAYLYGEPETVPNDGADLPEGVVLLDPANPAAPARRILRPVDGFRRIVRDDTNETLACPTDSYELISHGQMGELIEAYSDAWQQAGAKLQFETAGSLKGGRIVWAMIRLDEPFQVPGDDSATYPYAVLMNPHDGSGACKFAATTVRVVCWNTFSMADAQAERTGHQITIRHQGNVTERVDQAKVALRSLRDEANAWQAQATELAAINVDDALVRDFLEEFIPIEPEMGEKKKAGREKRRQVFMKVYEEGMTTVGLHGTAYGLVQTAGEFLDHLRPFQSVDTYMARTVLRPEPVKGRAIEKIRELVAASA